MAGDDGPTLRLCTVKSMAAGRDLTLKACPSNRKADEAPEKVSAPMEAGGEGVEARTKVKMVMSQEDIDSILNHKARGDSFKEFQARVAKEVEETGEFEVTEEHMKNVTEARAWIREELSNVRSQYPHLVWED
ncbi:unnamed protein product [Alopecurus aequalis]